MQWTRTGRGVTVLPIARGSPLQARTFVAYAMVLLAVAAQAASADAEVRVEGSAANVRVHAQNANRGEVLAALAARFDLRVHGAAGDGRFSVDLEGPLRRVIARVLVGYNYAIATHRDGLDVFVLDATSANAVPAPIYAPPTYPAANLRRDE